MLSDHMRHAKGVGYNQVIWTTRCKVMAKYISIYFDIFYEKLDDFGWPPARSKTKIFSLMICIGIFLACVQKNSENRNPPKKVFLPENVIFRGLRPSVGHFGQQAPKSPVSQLQNGVSTSSLPPFIVDLLTFKDYPRSNSFFSMGILEGVEWLISQAGPKQQW